MSTGTGKQFAYYDREKRESYPWGEPAQRRVIIEEEGRFKYVYADGSTAQGVLNPVAIKNAIEVSAVITSNNVEILPEPEADTGPEEAGEAAASEEKAA